MTTHLKYSLADSVATITLETSEGKPPTLDTDVLLEIEACIDRAKEEEPRIVFLRSNSERHFCVGANINVLKETNRETIIPWVKLGHRILNKLEDLPMPVVAVVEGYAMGGGLELAMACDLIFASDNARFAQSEAGLGFIPGWGGTRRFAQRIGFSKAKYYFYSGQIIAADKAAELGLIDFVSDKEGLEIETANFADSVIRNNRNALGQFKTIVNQQMVEKRDENKEIESRRSVSCLEDPETQQRLKEFLTKKGRK